MICLRTLHGIEALRRACKDTAPFFV